MRIKNTKEKYGSVAIALHWFMALLILGQLILGVYMVNFSTELEKAKLFGWHKSVGVLILILITLRLAWRMHNIDPVLPKHIPYWQQLTSKIVHYLLYIVLFCLPPTGWMLSSAAGRSVSFFGLFELPKIINPNEQLAHFFTEAHQWLAFGLIGLLFIHIGAVFQHYIFYKYNLLKRMLP